MNLSEELKNQVYYLNIIQEYYEKEKELPKGLLGELNSINTLTTNYKWSYPRMVKVPKSTPGKFREIFIFPELDSFYQKVINNILNTKCLNKINKNVFSYMKGVRCFDAASHIQTMLKNDTLFGAKLDISNYFLSVDKEVIFDCIDELVDAEDLQGRALLKSLFSTETYEHKGVINTQYLSLMPGSATSSFFANFVLKDVDSWLERNSLIFARYSDDILMFCEDEQTLTTVLKGLQEQLAKLGLHFNSDKTDYYHSKDIIDFLGLKITKDEIDINENTFKNTKSIIKNICKKFRKKLELNLNNRMDDLISYDFVESAIRALNKVFYNSILSHENEHRSGRVNYIFGNVTTIKTIQALDFYMRDRLRFLFTGKNNHGNISRLPNDVLDDLGFTSLVKMYYLYKTDLDIFTNEVYLLLKQKSHSIRDYRRLLYLPKERYAMPSESTFTTVVWNKSFSLLFYNILKSGYFYFNGSSVKAEHITFDLDNHQIRFKDLVIVQGATTMLDYLYCRINGVDYKIILSQDMELSDLKDRNRENLKRLFLQSCYHLTPGEELEFNSEWYFDYPFRKYSLKDLLGLYSKESLAIDVPYSLKYIKFMSYIYFHLNGGLYWQDIFFTKNFEKVKDDKFYIILKRDWTR